ncbi:GTP cyclohydrolase 1 type 2 [bioreactor metagenome]|uniref:GTP cyclohydrolase 1 type 2 n=1 Tax=bioreactor metagenome TaxID=1076179 RepID=A0A644ZAI5_9ZZZZ
MATVKEIYRFLDEKAPFSLQMDFDNSGFLVGRGDSEVRRILVSLDITEEVIEEARDAGAQLIVSHHPVIFHPVSALTDENPTGRKLMALVRNEIAAICLHTNLDLAEGGVNDALAAAAGLQNTSPLASDGLGRIGTLPKSVSLTDYALGLKNALGSNGLRVEDCGREVMKVAVGSGACGDLLKSAFDAGCDTFVTADVKYDVFLEAKALGVNLIDAGHYPTENVVCPVLAGWLRRRFAGTEILLSKKHKEVFTYL